MTQNVQLGREDCEKKSLYVNMLPAYQNSWVMGWGMGSKEAWIQAFLIPLFSKQGSRLFFFIIIILLCKEPVVELAAIKVN